MNKKRCPWPGDNALYISYHDNEWGRPLYDDQKLYELLTLETFQAGLSWITVLQKRDNFRKAFDNFDPKIVSHYDDKKREELYQNPDIIRNKMKIDAAINNAAVVCEIQKKGSFSDYIWKFNHNKPTINHYKEMQEVPAETEQSQQMSKTMKKDGFKFVGSKVLYAYMQAMGMVDDHMISCFCHTDNRDK